MIEDVRNYLNNVTCKAIELTGTIVKDNSYYNLMFDGVSDIQGSIQYYTPDASVLDLPVVVKGYAVGKSSATSGDVTINRIKIFPYEITVDQSIPYIKATAPASFKAEGETINVAFTSGNLGANQVYAKVDGAGFSAPSGEISGGTVAVTAAPNEGAAREATLTIYAAASEGGAAVAQATVTLKQLAKPTGDEGPAYLWTLASGDMKAAGGETPAVGEPTAMVWSYSSAGYLQMASNSSAMQIGSSKKPATDWSVWTEEYSGTISKIVVTVNTGGSATMIVKIGDTQIGEEVALESSPKAFTFEPTSPMSGKITINLKAASKAMYLKSIAINPAE